MHSAAGGSHYPTIGNCQGGKSSGPLHHLGKHEQQRYQEEEPGHCWHMEQLAPPPPCLYCFISMVQYLDHPHANDGSLLLKLMVGQGGVGGWVSVATKCQNLLTTA